MDQQKNISILIKIIAGIILAVVIGAFVSNVVRTGAGKGDFAALYQASAHAIETGTLDNPDSLGYYPPSGRPILMIFALLPLRPAAVLWFLIATAIHALCLYLLIVHLLPWKSANPRLLAAFVALDMAPWLSADLSGGNISPLILGCLVIGYYLYRKGYFWSSGLLLAVGIAVKFLPVFMIGFYAVKRQWKMTAIATATTLAVALIPGSLIFGPRDFAQSWKTWADTALAKCTAANMILEDRISYINQSWANVLLHTLSPVSAGHHDKPFYVNIANFSRTTVLKIWYAIMALSAVLWIWLIWPGKSDSTKMLDAHFPLVCLPMLWFSPHVMSYYLTILLPAVTFLIWAAMEKTDRLQPIRSKINLLLVLYILGCFSVASRYARAYGSYLLIIFVLALAVALIVRQTGRRPAETVDLPPAE